MIDLIVNHPYIMVILSASYIIGFVCAAIAILSSRTPQGATAWVMSLVSVPFFSVPFFMVFGRSKFEGYNSRRRMLDSKVSQQFDDLKALEATFTSESAEMKLIKATITAKNQPGFTRGNSIKLLINATEAYPEMLAALEKAENYIVFQFYIFRCDDIGTRFMDVLIRKAQSGVRVTFLNDEIGVKVPKRLKRKMEEAGIKVDSFNDRRGRGRMQVNFRNHRKIIVVDGKVGFVGGMNIGDDYLGKWGHWGVWRDTHIRLEGPSVIAAQLAAAKDWYCANDSQIDVDWTIHKAEEDSNVMVLHTGPADVRQTCLLTYLSLINSTKKRLWIANPYFVPPESIMDALLLASLRGVDVRIILPAYSDSKSVLLAGRVYQERLLAHGVKVYLYTKGFLHQKVMLVDDHFGVVGSVNMDCRSMFINFEIAVISSDIKLITNMEEMLTLDFKDCEEVKKEEFKKLPLLERLVSRGANLFAPIL